MHFYSSLCDLMCLFECHGLVSCVFMKIKTDFLFYDYSFFFFFFYKASDVQTSVIGEEWHNFMKGETMIGDCIICTPKPVSLVIGSISLCPEKEDEPICNIREKEANQYASLVHHLQIQAKGLILCWWEIYCISLFIYFFSDDVLNVFCTGRL